MIGCNIGEDIRAAIGFTLEWDMVSTLVLAVGLAFAIRYAFTIVPMLKTMPLTSITAYFNIQLKIL